MKKIVFTKNNSALAGVIEALLLIGLVAIILSTIQLYYVPVIMEQKETEHLDVVENQLSQLKSVIETQSIRGVLQEEMEGITDLDEAIAYSPMYSPVTLGSSKLSYFVTTWSTGQLGVIDEESAGTSNRIVLDPVFSDFSDGIPLTSIKYHSDNSYYEYDPDYYLEGSGIILSQSDGKSMIVQPAMRIENLTDSDNKLKIYYTLPLFSSIGGKDVYGGIDTTYIRTNFTRSYSYDIPGENHIDSLTIFSENIEAWKKFLTNETTGVLSVYKDDNHINYDDSFPDRIIITPAIGIDIELELTVIEIGVQVGPGIVN